MLDSHRIFVCVQINPLFKRELLVYTRSYVEGHIPSQDENDQFEMNCAFFFSAFSTQRYFHTYDGYILVTRDDFVEDARKLQE